MTRPPSPCGLILELACCLVLCASPAAAEDGAGPGSAAPSAPGAPEGRSPEPAPESVLAEIPFEADERTNRIFIDLAKPGRKPLVLLLDTGASHCFFSPAAARSVAGVTVRRHKSSPYRVATRLDRDLQFHVDTSSSDMGTRTGAEYGLIGTNFLEEYVVELDFERRRVRFLDSKKYRVPEQVSAADEAVLPMRLQANRPMIPVEIAGGSVLALLDTGVPWGATIGGREAKRLGIDVSALPEFFEAQSLRGPVPMRLFETDSLRIAGFGFPRLPVGVAPRGDYQISGPDEAIVGYDLISSFTVRLDYPRKRIWLRRERDTSRFLGGDYASMRSLGALVYPLGPDYAVFYVFPGSHADTAGFLFDDLIGGEALRAAGGVAGLADHLSAGGSIQVERALGDGSTQRVELPEDPASIAAGGRQEAVDEAQRHGDDAR